MKLSYIGKDEWSRPVYVCDSTLFVDVVPIAGRDPDICTKSNNYFDGEPDVSIRDIEKYKDEDIEFVPKRITWNYSKEHREWHENLVAYWKNKYGYSEEYCDAVAVVKRNYFPMSIERVPFK